jgi:hypothetical protein
MRKLVYAVARLLRAAMTKGGIELLIFILVVIIAGLLSEPRPKVDGEIPDQGQPSRPRL